MSFNNYQSALPRHTLAIAIAFASAGLATTTKAEDAYLLDKVVVTASRTAQTVDETLAPVTVITRKEIERSQAASIPELLNKTPGLQVASNGGTGSLAGIYLRGTKTAQTLVIVDGQKINSSSTGSSPLQYMSPEQIERIEIVRGPRSSLYGADAIGGVIQIFTRQGKGKPSFTAKLGGGSRNTGEYGLNLNGEYNDTRYNIGANLYETSGYDHTLTTKNGDDDKDAYRNQSIYGSLSHRFSNNVETGVNFSHSEGKSEYDNNYDNFTYTTQPYNIFRISNLHTYIAVPINSLWDTRLDIGYGEEHTQARKKDIASGISSDDYYTTTKRYSASWKNDISWHDSQLLTTGIDYSDEQYEGSTAYGENSRHNTAFFIQNLSYFDNSELKFGLRNDKNEAYGNKTTGNASFGYDLPADMRFITSYGTAFRAPTLGDLYYPGFSNPDLKPETSENIEFELRGKLRNGYWAMSLFQNNMKDMISSSEETGYRPMNVDKARIRGFELSTGTMIYDWDINASLSLLDPENRSTKSHGKVLVSRAKQLFTLNIDRQFDRLGVGASFRAQGKSYADATNTQKVAGFGTVDLRASIKLTNELKANLKLVNLLDKEYQAVKGYRGEPRGIYASLTWTPEL
ncbi:TonB-dependent receptor [Endozoicomonas sp. Mp262]|uniref:TonB-dependent receptor domain-containing protein n=1 Tax=Endozoicomonas sp. Mp262 TaxID=2919499 RepID=UPI0021E027EA